MLSLVHNGNEWGLGGVRVFILVFFFLGRWYVDPNLRSPAHVVGPRDEAPRPTHYVHGALPRVQYRIRPVTHPPFAVEHQLRRQTRARPLTHSLIQSLARSLAHSPTHFAHSLTPTRSHVSRGAFRLTRLSFYPQTRTGYTMIKQSQPSVSSLSPRTSLNVYTPRTWICVCVCEVPSVTRRPLWVAR